MKKLPFDEKELKKFVVKGYKRPDGTYYMSVPKAASAVLKLKGGEIFVLRVNPDDRSINVKLVELPGED